MKYVSVLLRSLLANFSIAVFVWSPVSGQGSPESFLTKAERFLDTRTDSAYYYAKQAETFAIENGSTTELAESYNLLGKIFFEEAAFNQSLENLLKAEALFAVLPGSASKAKNLNLVGEVYYYIRKTGNTYSYHRAALEIFSSLNDSLGIAGTYGYLGHYFEKTKQYDSALHYQTEALLIYERSTDWRGTVKILENIGSIYEDLANYAQAERYFVSAVELNNEFGSEEGAIHLYNNLGDIYFKTNRFDKAHELTERSLKLSREHSDPYQERSALRDLSQLYASERNYKMAYHVLDTSVNLYKEIYSDEGLKQVSRLQAMFETERKSKEIELLERDGKINRLVLALVAGGFVLVMVAAAAIVSRQKLRIRTNKEIFEAQQKLMQTEIESKGRALTTHTLQIIEKNKLLTDLRKEINDISNLERKDTRRELKKTTRKIDQNFYHEKDWESFKQIFEQIHQSFFDRLHSINSELSQADIRLAALMKMRMSSKDISTILGISKDSLRISRYRLRKKLFLSKEQKLGSFLQNLT